MNTNFESLKFFLKNSETGCILLKENSSLKKKTKFNIFFMNNSAKKMLGISKQQQIRVPEFIDNGIRNKSGKILSHSFNGYHLRIEFLMPSLLFPHTHLLLLNDITTSVNSETHTLILTQALDAVQDAVYAIDEDGNDLFHNQNIKRYDDSNRKEMLAELISVFKTGKEIKDKYLNYTTLDGKQVDILSNYFPVEKDGKIIAVVSINKFITTIRRWLKRAVDLQSQIQECSLISSGKINGTRYQFDDILGDTPIFKSIRKKAVKASYSFATILIQGETGIGKELFAQSIHNEGKNAEKPFIAAVCSAIPELLLESTLFGTKKGAFTGSVDTIGLFEQAKEGTLFLDEINSMPIHLQSKLLRVLEERTVRRVGGSIERPIKCRIISATNENLMDLINDGLFRQDLFYRLAGIVLSIPPLRQRSDDIFLLTNHFLKQMNKLYGKKIRGLSIDMKMIFKNHRWPGNVRELLHIIEGAYNKVENEDILTPDHLPDYFQPNINKKKESNSFKMLHQDDFQKPLPERLRKMEKEWVLTALSEQNGNVTKSAKSLGIQRQNLQSRMRRLNITKKLFFE
ncbi:MAG: sigma 54-interacting transcriptional regulator [Desulfobacterium sp.]